MNKFSILILSLFLTFPFLSILAQSPEKMNYQAVIRNSNSELIVNAQVGMQISILQGSSIGTSVYTETQTPTTNTNGLVSIEIGKGTTSDDFSNIDWSNGAYFIKIETDTEGGTNYTISGTSQLLSVPYALYAKVAGNIPDVSGITINSQAIQDSVSQIRADMPNVSGFATKISLGDSIEKVRNEIPNLSSLSTQQAFEDTVIQIRGDMFSGSYYDLTNQPTIPDVSGITINSQAIQDSSSQIRADMPNVSGFATKISLGDSIEKVRNEIPNLSNLATQQAFEDTITQIRGDIFSGSYHRELENL